MIKPDSKLRRLLRLWRKSSSPLLSIVVVVHNMNREARRTLTSLAPLYQNGVNAHNYEVIVVDNGSKTPFPAEFVAAMGPNFRLFSMENPQASPVTAVNFGVGQSNSRYVGIIIDGARILSPGVLRHTLAIFQEKPACLVATLGFHLGQEVQNVSILKGYNQLTEDALLDSIDWPNDGYRLFEIAALAGSSLGGWFKPMAESNCLFLPRHQFDKLGGYDPAFNLPGGGLANLDFYGRACALEELELVTLLGEGSFHQIHGGIATNVPTEELQRRHAVWMSQYELLRGTAYSSPTRNPLYYGHLSSRAFWAINPQSLSVQLTRETTMIAPIRLLPTEEAQLQLAAGDEHYMAYVGPPEYYDVIGASQFRLLTTLGLRDYHRVLDYGCGSLRAGRMLIPYLKPGHYTGVEPNRWLIEDAIKNEIGMEMIRIKQPVFSYDASFKLAETLGPFDFIVAQSILSHAGPDLFNTILEAFSRVLAPDGLVAVTVVLVKDGGPDYSGQGWIYPDLTYYNEATVTNFFSLAGLAYCRIPWRHRRQTWYLLARSNDRLPTHEQCAQFLEGVRIPVPREPTCWDGINVKDVRG